MVRVIEAVYEGGVLKPLERVDLREDQRVRVKIEEGIVDVVKRYRDELGILLSAEDVNAYLTERR
ncbi:MAG: antitoxin family protein [Candidatus Nezhaarchaeales archaeon]